MTTPARLIMFDGPDGVGKTTQLELVVEELEKQGRQVFVAHMLGGSPIGEAVRQVMMSDTPRPAVANLHLSLAAYYGLLDVVRDKLADGWIVLTDRSPLSLVAYQVYGDGLDQKQGFAACDETMQAFKPAAVIIYTAPADLLGSRREHRDKASDYFENLPADYHQRTLEGYLAAAKRYATPLIDSTADTQTIHMQTMQIINSLLGI